MHLQHSISYTILDAFSDSRKPICGSPPMVLWTQGNTFFRVSASQELTGNSSASLPCLQPTSLDAGLVLDSKEATVLNSVTHWPPSDTPLTSCVWIHSKGEDLVSPTSPQALVGQPPDLDICAQQRGRTVHMPWRCHTCGTLLGEPTKTWGAGNLPRQGPSTKPTKCEYNVTVISLHYT